MKFDPTKKFGTVYGQCTVHKGARFEQGGFVYDAHHKCLNPKEAEQKNSEDLVGKATKDLQKKKQVELEAVTDVVVNAQRAFDAEGTAAQKGNLTKAKKKYDTLLAEIESMGD